MDFNLPVPFGTSGFSKRILSLKSTRSGSSPSNLITSKLVRTWHRSLTLPPPALCASQCLRGSLRSFRFGGYSLLLHGEWMVNGKWYAILQKPLLVRLHVIKRKGLRQWNSEKPDNVCFTTRENWLLDFQVIVLPLKNDFVIHDERGLFWIASWIQLRRKKTCISRSWDHKMSFSMVIFFMTWNMKPQPVSQLETTPSMLFSRSKPNSLKISAFHGKNWHSKCVMFWLARLDKKWPAENLQRFPKLKSWDLQISVPNQCGLDSPRKPWNYFGDDPTDGPLPVINGVYNL